MGTRGAYPWVVLLDGRPAAGLLALPAGRRTLLIRQLFVDPEFRGLGLAAGLVEALKGVLAGAARSRLVALVREDDLDSQVFYRGLDFVCETTLCGRATGHVPLYRFAHAAGPRLRPS
jgi:GNAT superfamily N-acetyltransferase